MTQEARVLDYLRTFGSITSKEAAKELGVMQLPARIYRLRHRGHAISMETVSGENRYGDAVHYGVYRLDDLDQTLTDRGMAVAAGDDRAFRSARTYDEYKETRHEYQYLELIAREGSVCSGR